MIWGMIYCLLKFQTKFSIFVAFKRIPFSVGGNHCHEICTNRRSHIAHMGATLLNPNRSSRKFVHLSFLMWFEQFDQPMAMKERQTADESCPLGSIYSIFTQMWLIYGTSNIPYMHPMGFECGNFRFFKWWPASPKFLGLARHEEKQYVVSWLKKPSTFTRVVFWQQKVTGTIYLSLVNLLHGPCCFLKLTTS